MQVQIWWVTCSHHRRSGSGGDGAQSEGMIDLPGGAKGIAWAVYDQVTDTPVFRSTLGPQAPGKVSLIWNGTDLNGEQAPAGNYIIKANIVKTIVCKLFL